MTDARRKSRTFIGRSFVPLPALETLVRLHARSSWRPPCLQRHENRPDWWSRSVALLAQPHPKCPFQVVLRRVRAS